MDGGQLIKGGGGVLKSSPVGNQEYWYLSSIIQTTHRVINKVAIEMGFPCTCNPTIKESDGDGRRRRLIRRGPCLLIWPRW